MTPIDPQARIGHVHLKVADLNRAVGFYHGEDDVAFRVLGGNQSDSVSVARVGKDRLLEVRQPATVPALTGGPVNLTRSGEALSDNEA